MLFDTGASHTAICKKFLTDRGYIDFSKGGTLRQTANGKIRLDRCKVRNFQLVGFQEIDSFEVDVIETEFDGFQGLLGMDFISTLETWISSCKNQLFIAGGLSKFAKHVLDLTPCPAKQ